VNADVISLQVPRPVTDNRTRENPQLGTLGFIGS